MNDYGPGKKKLYHEGILVGEFEMTGDPLQDVKIASAIFEERGLNRPEVAPYISIFQQAHAFSKASTFLYERIVQKPPDPTAVTPFVVNITFSIELYLKSLALKHGKRLHGHELGKLLKKVPSAGRIGIEESLASLANSRWAEGTKSWDDLRQTARDLNSAFTDWRYHYERPSNPIGVHFKKTIYFVEVLHSACLIKDNPPIETGGPALGGAET